MNPTRIINMIEDCVWFGGKERAAASVLIVTYIMNMMLKFNNLFSVNRYKV